MAHQKCWVSPWATRKILQGSRKVTKHGTDLATCGTQGEPGSYCFNVKCSPVIIFVNILCTVFYNNLHKLV